MGLSLKQVRAKCLDCCAGEKRYVAYCQCDGVLSTSCSLWPHRFGVEAARFNRLYERGKEYWLKPGALPPHNVCVDNLPMPKRRTEPLAPTRHRVTSHLHKKSKVVT